MQHLMGLMRRCAEDYHMIEAGDRIAVGVSGGKDSLTLLYLLAGLRAYWPGGFTLEALTVDGAHVMENGVIVREGGPELVDEINEKGYSVLREPEAQV